MLVRLSEAPDPDALRRALAAIFFAAAARTRFAAAAERADFLFRWTGWYLEQAPGDVWFWREPDGTVAGYLTGCRDSAARPLFERIPF